MRVIDHPPEPPDPDDPIAFSLSRRSSPNARVGISELDPAVLPAKSSAPLLLALCLLPLASCANSPIGNAFQNAVAADPRLKDNPFPFGPNLSASPRPTVAQLPSTFPREIPVYFNSALQQVEQPGAGAGAASQGTVTRWSSPDRSSTILSFYQRELRNGDWRLIQQPGEANQTQGTIQAQRNDLILVVTVQPAGQASQFSLQYSRGNEPVASSSPTASPSGKTPPKPGDPDFIGPVPSTSTSASASPTPSPTPMASGNPTDLDKTPKELRQYVQDLEQLNLLSLTPGGNKTDRKSDQFDPNKVISRREYARWLVAVNNRLFTNRSAQQIRLGLATSQPAFQDVPRTDPDFPAIQGLAEAGLIPSSLSGDSTVVEFRPDEPLTRENLLLWKVPIDMRQKLPIATLEAVQQTWGFQDTARIDPRALRAVLADFQNGDQSNIRRAFGYTTLFQPKKPVTRAEAAAALWYIGFQGEGQSAQDAIKAANRQPSPSPSP